MIYTLDAREMEHPEPLEISVEILAKMTQSDSYRMRHRKEPFPLYEIARNQGFTYDVEVLSENDYSITFWIPSCN